MLATCTVEGCSNFVRARGLCVKHWERWRKSAAGKEGVEKRHVKGTAVKWIREVALAYEGDECLAFPFPRFPGGYGKITLNGKCITASNYLCELAHGKPTPERPIAAHGCGNGHLGCMTKRHLRWASHAENMQDRKEHGTASRSFRRLSLAEKMQIISLRNDGKSFRQIGHLTGRTPSSIRDFFARTAALSQSRNEAKHD